MAYRASLVGIALLSATVMLCGWWGGPVSEAVFLAVVAAFPGVLITVGVCRNGTPGPLILPLVILVLVLEGSAFGLLLMNRVPGFSATTGVGWPLAVMVVGLWVVPLILVTVSYAATFDRWILSADDLRQFDERRRGVEDRSQ